jgi:hypothetical protein
MKAYIACGIAALILIVAACNQKMNKKNPTEQPAFPTVEAAVAQAVQDLAAALKATEGANFGVRADDLTNAAPLGQIKQRTLNFERLIGLDSTSAFRSLVADEEPVLVPVGVNNSIATTVTLAKGNDGWKVASIGGSEHKDDLNQLPDAVKNRKFDNVTVYYVPNIEAKIFVVEENGTELCYTNYNGMSMREGIPANALYKRIQSDAVEFQRKYGERLKKGRLLR